MRMLIVAICLALLYGTPCFAGTVDELNAAIKALNKNQPEHAKGVLFKIVQNADAGAEHKGLAYYLLSFTEKNSDDAIIYCNKAVELVPDDSRFFERLGSLYHQKKLYAKALEMLDKAISITPINAMAFSLRGVAHRDMGSLDKALSDMDKAISLNPSVGVFYVRRGVARFLANQQDAALEDFAAAVERRVPQPLKGICYYYSAKVHQNKNDHAKAKSLYQSAVRHLTEEEKLLDAQRMLEQIEAAEKWG